MFKENKVYISLIFLHIFIGLIVLFTPKISVIYGFIVVLISLYTIIKTKNKNNQVLYFAAYAVGNEVFIRMTGGFLLYETGKYSVIIYMLLGLVYSGFSKSAFPYWFFLIILIPGIIIGASNMGLDVNIRKAIVFNISGPFCLGISAIYCMKRKITIDEISNVLMSALLPIIATISYLFFYAPSVKEVVTGTESNFITSGGFGPNQVSTIIGLGIFIIFTRIVFNSKSLILKVINLFLFFIFTFRGLVTFSRGGMISAFVMIILFIFTLNFVLKSEAKLRLVLLSLFSVVAFFLIWGYSTLETNGLIVNRYTNKDALGRSKSSLLSGREVIISQEIDIFLANPIFGVGVGKSKETRKEISEDTGIATHNEFSRLLAEHGVFGIIAVLILVCTPFILYINNKQHIFLLSLFSFWLLTINHAATRIAAPAFVYALSLLQVYSFNKKVNKQEGIENEY